MVLKRSRCGLNSGSSRLSKDLRTLYAKYARHGTVFKSFDNIFHAEEGLRRRSNSYNPQPGRTHIASLYPTEHLLKKGIVENNPNRPLELNPWEWDAMREKDRKAASGHIYFPKSALHSQSQTSAVAQEHPSDFTDPDQATKRTTFQFEDGGLRAGLVRVEYSLNKRGRWRIFEDLIDSLRDRRPKIDSVEFAQSAEFKSVPQNANDSNSNLFESEEVHLNQRALASHEKRLRNDQRRANNSYNVSPQGRLAGNRAAPRRPASPLLEEEEENNDIRNEGWWNWRNADDDEPLPPNPFDLEPGVRRRNRGNRQNRNRKRKNSNQGKVEKPFEYRIRGTIYRPAVTREGIMSENSFMHRTRRNYIQALCDSHSRGCLGAVAKGCKNFVDFQQISRVALSEKPTSTRTCTESTLSRTNSKCKRKRRELISLIPETKLQTSQLHKASLPSQSSKSRQTLSSELTIDHHNQHFRYRGIQRPQRLIKERAILSEQRRRVTTRARKSIRVRTPSPDKHTQQADLLFTVDYDVVLSRPLTAQFARSNPYHSPTRRKDPRRLRHHQQETLIRSLMSKKGAPEHRSLAVAVRKLESIRPRATLSALQGHSLWTSSKIQVLSQADFALQRPSGPRFQAIMQVPEAEDSGSISVSMPSPISYSPQLSDQEGKDSPTHDPLAYSKVSASLSSEPSSGFSSGTLRTDESSSQLSPSESAESGSGSDSEQVCSSPIGLDHKFSRQDTLVAQSRTQSEVLSGPGPELPEPLLQTRQRNWQRLAHSESYAPSQAIHSPLFSRLSTTEEPAPEFSSYFPQPEDFEGKFGSNLSDVDVDVELEDSNLFALLFSDSESEMCEYDSYENDRDPELEALYSPPSHRITLQLGDLISQAQVREISRQSRKHTTPKLKSKSLEMASDWKDLLSEQGNPVAPAPAPAPKADGTKGQQPLMPEDSSQLAPGSDHEEVTEEQLTQQIDALKNGDLVLVMQEVLEPATLSCAAKEVGLHYAEAATEPRRFLLALPGHARPSGSGLGLGLELLICTPCKLNESTEKAAYIQMLLKVPTPGCTLVKDIFGSSSPESVALDARSFLLGVHRVLCAASASSIPMVNGGHALGTGKLAQRGHWTDRELNNRQPCTKALLEDTKQWHCTDMDLATNHTYDIFASIANAALPSIVSEPRSCSSQSSLSTFQECAICADDLPSDGMVRLHACGHRFCNRCFLHYLLVSMRHQTTGKIECPASKCATKIDPVTLASFLPLDKFSILGYRMRDLELAKLPCVLRCPNVRCAASIHMPFICTGPEDTATCPKYKGTEEKEKEVRDVCCPHCRYYFCATCRKAAHWPAACKNAALFEQQLTRRQDDVDNVLTQVEQVYHARVKRCPSCREPIEKNSGCQHMTCSRCTHQFCWECLEPWTTHMEGNWRCSTPNGVVRLTIFEIGGSVEASSAASIPENLYRRALYLRKTYRLTSFTLLQIENGFCSLERLQILGTSANPMAALEFHANSTSIGINSSDPPHQPQPAPDLIHDNYVRLRNALLSSTELAVEAFHFLEFYFVALLTLSQRQLAQVHLRVGRAASVLEFSTRQLIAALERLLFVNSMAKRAAAKRTKRKSWLQLVSNRSHKEQDQIIEELALNSSVSQVQAVRQLIVTNGEDSSDTAVLNRRQMQRAIAQLKQAIKWRQFISVRELVLLALDPETASELASFDQVLPWDNCAATSEKSTNEKGNQAKSKECNQATSNQSSQSALEAKYNADQIALLLRVPTRDLRAKKALHRNLDHQREKLRTHFEKVMRYRRLCEGALRDCYTRSGLGLGLELAPSVQAKSIFSKAQ